MTKPRHDEEAIFKVACQIVSPDARAAYLNQVCGDSPAVQQRIGALLHIHDDDSQFLQAPFGLESPPAFELPQSEAPGAQIGPYKLIEQIGEGGMGLVYMAEQQQPVKRMVALKLIKPGMDSRQVIARLDAERQALAMMDHPGIARLIDAGTTSRGRPYFVMELVRGIPITTFCDEKRLTIRQRLELMVQVCQAVQHAHQKGIIHRDLKPSNVLVTMADATPLPKVIDFGIAKALGPQLTEHTMHTGFAQLLGTPLYMSPEQAEMNQFGVDTRSDIYSLGVLLYELLTGATPFTSDMFQQAGLGEMSRMIREMDPLRPSMRLSTLDGLALSTTSEQRGIDPRRLSSVLCGELDWIVMKALEKERNRRYETANGFAADIQRYLNDEPVLACPPSAAYRLRKLVRRHKVSIVTISLTVLALVAGTVLSAWQAIRATRAEGLAENRFEREREARVLADEAEKQAISDRDLARRRQFDARIAQARAGRKSGVVGQRIDSLKAIEEAVDLARDLGMKQQTRMELRNEAIACLGLTDVGLQTAWVGWNPDSRDSLAVDPGLEHYAKGDFKGNITVHRTGDGRELLQLSSKSHSEIGGLTFSPNGDLLAVASATPEVWEWRQNKRIWQASFRDAHHCVFHPNGKDVAVRRTGGVISLVNLASGQETSRIVAGAEIHNFSFAPDGTKLAVACYQLGRVQIHDVSTGEILQQWNEPSGPFGVAWHPEGRLVAVWSNDFRIRLWNAGTGREHSSWQGHVTSTVVHAEFDATGDRLMTWAWDGTTRLWDPWSSRELVQISGLSSRLRHDGKKLFTLRGSRFFLWDVVGGDAYRSLPTWELDSSTGVLNWGAGISPDGRWLAVSGTSGARVIDLARNQPVGQLLEGHNLRNVAFHPSGRELFLTTSSDVQSIPFTREQGVLKTGAPVQVAPIGVRSLSFDASGELLALGNRGGGLLVRLARPVEPPIRLWTGQNGVADSGHLAVSPDGRWVAIGNHLGRGARVWDALSGKLERELLTDPTNIRVRFTPNGQYVVTTSATATIYWKIGTWEEHYRIAPGETLDMVEEGQESASGSNSLTSAYDLHDPNTGQVFATLYAPDNLSFGEVRLTPAGDRLVVFSARPAHVRIWDLRFIRGRLVDLGLDWEAPPLEAADTSPAEPVRLEANLTNGDTEAPRAKQARGDQHRVHQEYLEAIDCYGDVLEAEPHHTLILNRLAWLLAIGPPEVRDGHQALKLVERARAWEPTNPYFLNTLGAAQYRSGLYAEALRSLLQAEKQFQGKQDFTWPHNWLVQALCLAKLGQGDAARGAYEKSVAWLKNPGTSSPAYQNEAELLRREVESLLPQVN